jgi:hypothetical protein
LLPDSPMSQHNLKISRIALAQPTRERLLLTIFTASRDTVKMAERRGQVIRTAACSREITGSNTDTGTGYPDLSSSWLSSVPPGKCRSSTSGQTTHAPTDIRTHQSQRSSHLSLRDNPRWTLRYDTLCHELINTLNVKKNYRVINGCG